MAATNIEWADRSWNAVVGCSIVSPGCTNCYAMAMAHRINQMTLSSHYEELTERSKNGKGRAVWTGKVAMAPDHILTAPLGWRKPSRIFVNSMGDLFHESVHDDWIDRVFAVAALVPWHTFIVLTKRARRMREYLVNRNGMGCGPICRAVDAIPVGLGGNRRGALEMPLPNVHLGVSCEDQARADERIPDLLATPAAVRFVSAEPLLGPINFRHINVTSRWRNTATLDALSGETRLPGNCGQSSQTFDGPSLDWIICGGESGPGARPMHVELARSMRDQFKAVGVPFFMKQLGSHVIQDGKRLTLRDRKGADMSEWPHDLRIQEFPR